MIYNKGRTTDMKLRPIKMRMVSLKLNEGDDKNSEYDPCTECKNVAII